VKVLVNRGASLSLKDRAGRTPYTLAVAKGHKETAEYLQKRGGK
jgi:ankyrin repeat protein